MMQNMYDVYRHRFMQWSIFAYILFLPMQFSTPLGFRFAPSDVFLFTYFLTVGSNLRLIKSSWSIWHLLLLVLFVVGNIVSAFHNMGLTRYVLLDKDFGLITLFAEYVMVISYAADWQQIRQLIRIFIINTCLQNVVALCAFFVSNLTGTSISWMNYEGARLSGMLVDPNAYGGFLVLAFALHIATCRGKEPLVSGWFGIFTTISLGMGILLTFSRSSWIGLAIVVLISSMNQLFYLLRVLFIGGVAFGGVLLILGNNYISTISQMSQRATIASRLNVLQWALDGFMNSPVFGLGIGTSEQQYGLIVHNTTFWFLTEFGIFGLLGFMGFILWFVLKGFSTYRLVTGDKKRIVLGLFLAFLAMYGLSMGIEAFYQRHWWVVMGLLAAAASIARKQDVHESLNSQTRVFLNKHITLNHS